jgi:hypothetical protein
VQDIAFDDADGGMRSGGDVRDAGCGIDVILVCVVAALCYP